MATDGGRAARTAHGGGDVLTQAPALWSRVGSPPRMPKPHRHDDVELNHVRTGRLQYLFGGTQVRVGPGEVALFWGATPHQLVEPGTEPGQVSWLHVPLATALAWPLGADDVAALLRSEPVVVPAVRLGRDVGALFEVWHREVQEGDADVALLEVQALVRRLLREERRGRTSAAAAGGAPGTDPSPGGSAGAQGCRRDHLGATVAMARFIADHFREPVATSDVARAAHLNPTYAMTLFRRTVGCTIGAYLTRCRVAEAQRLLIATARTTTEIAEASGFGSQTQFYEHFTRTCGQAPGRYRAAVRRG